MVYNTAMYCYHHSRNASYRFPQGAAPCGSRIRLTLDADGGDWYLWLQTPEKEAHIPLVRLGGQYSTAVEMPSVPGLVHYCFYTKGDARPRFYGAQSGEGQLFNAVPECWQISVYLGGFSTPEWFRRSLCYQVFPDRFARSDFAAFKQRAERRHTLGRSVRIHENWAELPCYLPEAGKAHYVPDDYFGGDICGIRERLPYLHSLGVTSLYLNPIFEAFSNHRYNTADYMQIDSLLGTRDDFERLCTEANKYGIKVILDGVFSHTGDDSRYFDRAGRYGGGACESKNSPYYPWYTFHDYPNRYESWWGFPSLPNVDELNPEYTEFITGKSGVLATWQGNGADGWRLDVADELPDAFIRKLRSAVKRNNPEALLLGEVWDDCSTKTGALGRRAYVNGDLLDGTMNYPFLKAVLSFCAGTSDAFALNESLQKLRENYPEPFFMACLNLLSSHDEPRALARLCGGTAFEGKPRQEQATFEPSAEQYTTGVCRFLMASAIQFCHPGVPCLYYGDEAGCYGLADPFNRKTFPWGKEDTDLQSAIKQLTLLRSKSEALMCGRTRMGALSVSVFALIRYTDYGEVVLLLLNSATDCGEALLYPALLWEGADALYPVPFAGHYKDVANGETVDVSEMLLLTLPPLSYTILRKER